MSRFIERGHLDAFTLRFEDPDLETRFQTEEGQLGLSGYRIITGAVTLLWILAAVLIPLGTDITTGLAWQVGGTMALAGLVALAVSPWAQTMNRQHALASVLTSANGLVILLLAVAGDEVAGFAVPGIMLLYMFGFVSRTRFVYALARTVVIAAGFAVVWAISEEPHTLVMDAFFLFGASVASLLGLRLIERNRRQVWHQRLVIEEQSAAIEIERAESERLLLNVLPSSVSERLKHGENPIADDFADVTVLFADIVGFTEMTSTMSADQVIMMLSELFSTFDDLVTERGLEKIKTIGDAYMAVGGLPDPLPDHAERVVDLAVAMETWLVASQQYPGLAVRIGVHSGPVAGGVIGTQKFAYDVWGNTVNVAARLQATSLPGRIHVSEETRSLTNGVFEYEPRGPVELRGLRAMTTYLVAQGKPIGQSPSSR